MRFQSLGNLEKKYDNKLKILCPFIKNCDVTTRICTYSIFKPYVIETFLSESSKIWHTCDSTWEEDENIIFLFPWQHVRFQTPFLLLLKYSFNYLTGKQFQPIVVKS